MPRLISVTDFPSLRKDPEDVFERTGVWPSDVHLDGNGFTADGMIAPGILDMGRILGTARFTGLPRPVPVDDSWTIQPASGAEVVVTVLYQRSHRLLRRFLECDSSEEFIYAHFHATGEKGMPFVITRKGDKVEAGFRKGYVNGTISLEWHEFARYSIQLSGAWRQDFIKTSVTTGLNLVGALTWTPNFVSLNNDASRDERLDFEIDAVHILRPALVKRLWLKQPSFEIEAVVLHAAADSDSPKAKSADLTQVSSPTDQDAMALD